MSSSVCLTFFQLLSVGTWVVLALSCFAFLNSFKKKKKKKRGEREGWKGTPYSSPYHLTIIFRQNKLLYCTLLTTTGVFQFHSIHTPPIRFPLLWFSLISSYCSPSNYLLSPLSTVSFVCSFFQCLPPSYSHTCDGKYT